MLLGQKRWRGSLQFRHCVQPPRLIVEGARPNCRAIKRRHCLTPSPRETSSRSARLYACLARVRSAGRIPPVGDSTEKIDDDSRSNNRPIELIDSPLANDPRYPPAERLNNKYGDDRPY